MTPTRAELSPATYELHGLAVASELPLDAPRTDRSPDWTVTVGAPCSADRQPDGRITSRLQTEDVAFWLAEQDEGSRLLRHRGLADFEIAGDRITARPANGADPGLLSILLAGSVLAHLISSEGGLVLHASAVELNGTAVALLGQSGAGKSTTAAVLCAGGTPLFTDDALAVEDRGGKLRCHRGTWSLRLRPQAAALADGLASASVEPTADGRAGVRPAFSRRPTLPLGAVAAIRLDAEPGEVLVEPLAGREAVMALLASPRVISWADRSRQADYFRAAASVADIVPVVRLRLPRASSMSAGLSRTLIAALAPLVNGDPPA